MKIFANAVGGPLATGSGVTLTSRQWLARIGFVSSLAVSQVIVPATYGIGGWRIALLSLSAVAFLLAYLVGPSATKSEVKPADLRPVLVMIGAATVAVGVTGGLTSPMLPLLVGPILIGWTTLRWRPRTQLLHAVVPLVVVVALVPASFAPTPFTRAAFAVVAGWTTFLVAWLIGLRITGMHAAMCTTARRLNTICEGALSDAASRRRGLESVTTKLAHELKNPLAAIKSLVQLELARSPDDKAKRRLDVVLAESDRIGAILRDYLDRARPVEDVQIEDLELDELMTEIATLVAGRAEAAGVDLSVSGAGGSLRGDPRLLKEALVNITSNAIEATPRGGFVDVTYHRGMAGASITVRDSGKGMSKDVSARVGTPFFTTREDGTGLGVVIAQTAIAQHGGQLAYTSTPGVGTIATIALPLAPGSP